MATKKICDRCGAEINPADGAFYAGLSQYQFEGKLNYELCGSCAYHLGRWLDGKEHMEGEERDDDPTMNESRGCQLHRRYGW